MKFHIFVVLDAFIFVCLIVIDVCSKSLPSYLFAKIAISIKNVSFGS